MKYFLIFAFLFSTNTFAKSEMPHELLEKMFNTATESATLEDFPIYPIEPTGGCFFTMPGKDHYYQKDAYVRMFHTDAEGRTEDILGTHYELTHYSDDVSQYQTVYDSGTELVIEENLDFAQLVMMTEFRKTQGMLIARIKFDYRVESYMYCKN